MTRAKLIAALAVLAHASGCASPTTRDLAREHARDRVAFVEAIALQRAGRSEDARRVLGALDVKYPGDPTLRARLQGAAPSLHPVVGSHAAPRFFEVEARLAELERRATPEATP